MQKNGVMRLANALDEIEPIADPRVQENEAYLGVVILSRTVVSLGDISPVGEDVMERLYSADYSFLQEMYMQINSGKSGAFFEKGLLVETQCPGCQSRFGIDLGRLS